MKIFPIAISALWLEILSDWLVNLSAGWFSVVVAIPLVFDLANARDLVLLTLNVFVGILALFFAKMLRDVASFSQK